METTPRLAYLFRRYIDKLCSPEEKEELFTLLLKPEHDDTLRRLIAETWNEDHPDYYQDRVRADNILQQIIHRREAESPPDSASSRPPFPGVFLSGLRAILFNRWAACFLVFIGLTPLAYHLLHPSQHRTTSLAHPATVAARPAPEEHCVTLPDGSKVLLHKTARIDYRSGFTGSSRELTLHGEAYFDIHKDPRPFIVHTGAIRTIVLGTAFNINANDERDIVITVTKGKVKVENEKGEFSILRRNEQLSADPLHLQKTAAINAGEALAWKKTWLLFNDVPMMEAMDTLAQHYHLTIVFTNPAAKGCPVTATFNGGESLEQMVNVLSKINNMQYAIDHDRVTITGDGCK